MPTLVGDCRGPRPALDGRDDGSFVGGVGRGRAKGAALKLGVPDPTGSFGLSGLVDLNPAPTMAAFSSACVGNLIGDLTRGGSCVAWVGEGRLH